MRKKFDGTFSSDRLEDEFKTQQLSGIIQLYSLLQKILLVIYFVAIITNIMIRNWIVVSFIIILAIVSFTTMKSFQKRPRFTCLTWINATNIICACYRLYASSSRNAHEIVNYNEEYVRGAALFAVHLSLLVNPRLSTNIFILSIVVGVNFVVLSLNNGGFLIFGLGIIPCILLYLVKLNIDLQTKRKLFSL